MNKTRVQELINHLESVAPDITTFYTKQELIKLLQELQRELLAGVYEKNHAKHMCEKDLLLHFKLLAEQYGLVGSEAFARFEKNLRELSYTIGTFIKGMKGEQTARRSLKLLSFDKNVIILYNVELEDEDAKGEYDAIVISPYGIFVVEVKNWGTEVEINKAGIMSRKDTSVTYDLAGRMNTKEALLRKYLGNLFPLRYQAVLQFPDINTSVEDLYGQIPICYGEGISGFIRTFNDGEELLTGEQITRIAEVIQNNHKEQRSLCKVNCKEIIEDYAYLMAAIEEAADMQKETKQEVNMPIETINRKKKTIVIKRETKVFEPINQEVSESISIGAKPRKGDDTAYKVVGTLAAFGLGYLASRVIARNVKWRGNL